jgi:Protein of unknown function (DUF3800)
VIVSYADESGFGRDRRYPFLALAGYYGPIAAWKGFVKRWANILEEFDLTTFHMTDFLARNPPFDKWSDGTCEHCFGRLVETIHTYHIRGFAVQIPWEEYDRRLSRSVKKIFTKHPYILAFDTVITELLRVMYLRPLGEQLTMYFHNSSLETKAKAVYRRRRERDRWGDRLAEVPFFVSDVGYPAIQAADILASLLRNVARGRKGRELPMEDIHRYTRLLISYDPPIVRLLDSRELDRAEKHLSTFLKKKG